MNQTSKAVYIREIGYPNKKKRGIDSGDKVLKFLCDKYNITITTSGDFITYSVPNKETSQPWKFRKVSCNSKLASWDHIENICTFIEEDVEYYPDNRIYWPYFKLV